MRTPRSTSLRSASRACSRTRLLSSSRTILACALLKLTIVQAICAACLPSCIHAALHAVGAVFRSKLCASSCMHALNSPLAKAKHSTVKRARSAVHAAVRQGRHHRQRRVPVLWPLHRRRPSHSRTLPAHPPRPRARRRRARQNAPRAAARAKDRGCKNRAAVDGAAHGRGGMAACEEWPWVEAGPGAGAGPAGALGAPDERLLGPLLGVRQVPVRICVVCISHF